MVHTYSASVAVAKLPNTKHSTDGRNIAVRGIPVERLNAISQRQHQTIVNYQQPYLYSIIDTDV